MVAPGLDKVIFLHVLHPNMCLQAEEQAQAETKADELDEQKRAAKDTANARRQDPLCV